MINIDERFYIETDDNNFVLCSKKKSKGNAVIGYYSKLQNLLKDLSGRWMREEFKERNAELTEAINLMLKKQAEYEQMIEKAFRGI